MQTSHHFKQPLIERTYHPDHIDIYMPYLRTLSLDEAGINGGLRSAAFNQEVLRGNLFGAHKAFETDFVTKGRIKRPQQKKDKKDETGYKGENKNLMQWMMHIMAYCYLACCGMTETIKETFFQMVKRTGKQRLARKSLGLVGKKGIARIGGKLLSRGTPIVSLLFHGGAYLFAKQSGKQSQINEAKGGLLVGALSAGSVIGIKALLAASIIAPVAAPILIGVVAVTSLAVTLFYGQDIGKFMTKIGDKLFKKSKKKSQYKARSYELGMQEVENTQQEAEQVFAKKPFQRSSSAAPAQQHLILQQQGAER